MNQPNSDLGLLFLRSLDHTQLRHKRTVGLPERVFSSSQKLLLLLLLLLLHIKNTSHEHPCPQRDSSPWSQQSSGRRLSLAGILISNLFIVFMPRKSLVSQSLLIPEASQSHSEASRFVGFLWTSDQPDAETSTWQHPTVARYRYPCPWRDSNPQSQQRSGGRPTP